MPAEAKRHCSPSRIYDLVMRYNPIPRVRVFHSGSDFDDSLSWLGEGSCLLLAGSSATWPPQSCEGVTCPVNLIAIAMESRA